ncbi:MAG: hypothetical protein AAFR73_13155 [Pseudomonadota bacterium]
MDLKRQISELSEAIRNIERKRQHAPNTIIDDELSLTIDRLAAQKQYLQDELDNLPSRSVTLVKRTEQVAVGAAFLFLLANIVLAGTAQGGSSAYTGYTYASKLHLAAYGALVVVGLRRLLVRVYRERHRILTLLKDIKG